MNWENDGGLQREVDAALVKALQRHVLPNFDWIKTAIIDCPDGDWGSPDVRRDNIEDIVKAAKKLASWRDQPLNKEELKERSFSKESAANTYWTAEVMRESTEKVRLKYWGETVPPFSMDKQGFDAAGEWLKNMEKDDYERTSGFIHSPFEITLHFTSLENATMNDFFHRVYELVRQEEVPLENVADLIKSLTAFEEHGCLRFEGYKIDLPSYPFISLQHPFYTDLIMVVVSKGMALEKLQSDLAELCEESGCWTEREALDYLLFNRVEGNGINVKVDGDFIRNGKITITVDMPATAEQVKLEYEKLLKDFRCAPVTLTKQQEHLLHHVESMPNSSWPERFKAWQEHCSYMDMRISTYSNWRSLYRAHNYAKSRADLGWNRKLYRSDEKSTA